MTSTKTISARVTDAAVAAAAIAAAAAILIPVGLVALFPFAG